MALLKKSIDYIIASAPAALLAIALVVLMLPVIAGCTDGEGSDDRLKVAADIFPLADFCAEVGGALVEVETLVPPGATPHTFELTTAQMRFLEEADMLVSNGLDLTPWAEGIFTRTGGAGTVEVVAGEAVPEEELVKIAGSGGGIYDPHVWLDPDLAMHIVEAIRDGMCEADPENAAVFRENAERYVARLGELDARIAEEAAAFSTRKFIAFHSTWTYFARRYGLEQVGVIEELPGKEPSAGEIAELVDMVEARGVRVIFAEQQFNPRVAETIAEESGGEVVVKLLDPLGDPGDTRSDTYLKMMERNVEIMKEALG
ncbi:MAG: metal ABC transporter substrate-binding protein [Actinomycetota bacterium]|nr:metal ABC transporter substrate-binding protein [Actinomycetota bacterium]MDD5666586.1 metal ABC transporter substrate-binding protein [Actinomycetota bacterium]